MKTCESCNDEFDDTIKHPAIIAAGGWCAPTDQLYEIASAPVLCPDCNARWSCIMNIGIDPGRHGENLKFSRGGIKFHRPETT